MNTKRSLPLRWTVLAVLVLALSAPLAACGKKGKLDPPNKESQHPRTYPTSR